MSGTARGQHPTPNLLKWTCVEYNGQQIIGAATWLCHYLVFALQERQVIRNDNKKQVHLPALSGIPGSCVASELSRCAVLPMRTQHKDTPKPVKSRDPRVRGRHHKFRLNVGN